MPAHEAAHICLGAPVTGKTTGQFFEAVVFETTVLNTIKIKWLNVVPVPLALTSLTKGMAGGRVRVTELRATTQTLH